jgi:hypothetical protein
MPPMLIFQISYLVALVTLGTLQTFTLSEGLAGDAWEPSEQNSVISYPHPLGSAFRYPT